MCGGFWQRTGDGRLERGKARKKTIRKMQKPPGAHRTALPVALAAAAAAAVAAAAASWSSSQRCWRAAVIFVCSSSSR